MESQQQRFPFTTLEENPVDLNDRDLQMKFNDLCADFLVARCEGGKIEDFEKALALGSNFAQCALVVVARAVRNLRIETERADALEHRVREGGEDLDRARQIVDQTVRQCDLKMQDMESHLVRLEELLAREREEKDRLVEEKDSLVEEKDRMVEEFESRLGRQMDDLKREMLRKEEEHEAHLLEKEQLISQLREDLRQAKQYTPRESFPAFSSSRPDAQQASGSRLGKNSGRSDVQQASSCRLEKNSSRPEWASGSRLDKNSSRLDPQQASNSLSKEDFLDMIRASETSILDKVQSMLGRGRSTRSGQHPRHVFVIDDEEQHSVDSPQVRKKGEEWFKFCKTITPYRPDSSKELGIDEFLTALRSKLKTVSPPYNNQEKVSILRMTLEGSAQVALESYPSEVQCDFEQLCLRLMRDFGRFSCEDAAVAALKGKEGKQGPNERPAEFARRLQVLCAKAYGNTFRGREDIQLRIAFAEGLIPQVKEKVEALALSSLDDMVSKAEIFYHKLKPSKPKEVQVYQVSNEQPELVLESDREPPASTGKDAPQSKPNSPKINGKTCFRCGRQEHFVRFSSSIDSSVAVHV